MVLYLITEQIFINDRNFIGGNCIKYLECLKYTYPECLVQMTELFT